MPLDAICLSAVVRETAAQVENTRIEKIQQPARDQVVLHDVLDTDGGHM